MYTRSNIIFIDIETTGLSIKNGHEITEIGYQIYNNQDVLIKEVSKIVKINQKIPFFITKLTGITDEMCASGSNIDDVIIELNNDLKSCNKIVAYNILFDITFLKYYGVICKDIQEICCKKCLKIYYGK